jgi:hypothetical protein
MRMLYTNDDKILAISGRFAYLLTLMTARWSITGTQAQA